MLSYWVSIAIVFLSLQRLSIINCLPIKLSDIQLTAEDAEMLIGELEHIKVRVKDEAFEAFSSEIQARGTSVQSVKNIIDVVKFVMEETRYRIDEIIENLETFKPNPNYLNSEARLYVETVIEMIPEIIPFVRNEYRTVLLKLKKMESV